jgi:colanic acid biosynthesis glycosyl transferase WcaI
MRILFFSDNFYPEVNAAASRVYERAKYWVKWGHQVTIVTSVPNFPEGKIQAPYENRWYQTENIEGIEVIRVKTFIARNKGTFKRIADYLSYFFSTLIQMHRFPKSDVIVATTPQFFCAVSAMIISKIKKTSFVIEVSDLWPDSIIAVGAMKKSFLLSLIEKLELYLYQSAKQVIVLTQAFSENLIARKVPHEKISVIINGAEISQFYPLPRNTELMQQYHLENKCIIGYIGTFGMAQDLIEALKIAHAMRHNPDVIFVFIGTGAEEEKLKNYAEENSLSNVIFIEKQAKNKINDFWSICDFSLVHLKNNIAFKNVIPSKIFEAMATHTPIILIAPEGEASALIENNEIGLSIQAGDPQKAAEIIESIYQEHDIITQWKNNSAQKLGNYTREKQAEKFIDVLKK